MAALVEMGIVISAVPRPGAPDSEVAHWYEMKAQLLELLAEDARAAAAEADRMRLQASIAHEHARTLYQRTTRRS